MRDPSALQVESFLEMMSAERGAATNTLQSYERDLEDARSFLNERGVRLSEAVPDDLRAYLGHLAQREQVERERLKDLATAQEAQRSVTLEANRHVQVLDTLQARQRTQYLTEVKRLEQKSLDEITTMAFVRRRLEGQFA